MWRGKHSAEFCYEFCYERFEVKTIFPRGTDLLELMKCMKTFRKHILQEGAGPEAFEFLRKMENHCLTKMLDASTTQAKISDFLN